MLTWPVEQIFTECLVCNIHCVPATVIALEVQKRFPKSPHLQVHSNGTVVLLPGHGILCIFWPGDLHCPLLEKDPEGHILGYPCGLASCQSVLSVVEPLLLLG